MLPVLPFVVERAGGGTAAAGLITGAAFGGTVLIELASPLLLSRLAPKTMLGGGFALSAAATAGLAAFESLPVLVALGGAYGVGLGLGGTVVSMLPGAAPAGPARRSAYSVFGLGSTLPSVVGPPAALLAIPWIGPEGVFIACAGVSVIGLGFARAVTRPLAKGSSERVARPAGARIPWVVLLSYTCITFTWGGVASFTAMHLDDDGLDSAVTFFVVFGVARGVFRMVGSHALAVVGEGTLAAASMLAATAGLACLAVGSGALIPVAALLYGAGLGTAQTTTLVEAAGPAEDPSPSGVAAWNFSTDAGLGLGALALAPVAAALSYGSVFALLPAMTVLGLVLHTLGARQRARAPVTSALAQNAAGEGRP
jgi:MFS family permease